MDILAKEVLIRIVRTDSQIYLETITSSVFVNAHHY